MRAAPVLEIIAKGRMTEAHPSPVLFVHGSCHAAWCWDDHFLDYFAGQGFHAAAVSLRGHGTSTSDKRFNTLSLTDYVDDVRTVVDALGGNPVLVGHSMGGFVVQHYLGRYDAPAAILLASLPPSGMVRPTWRMTRAHPWTLLRAATFGDIQEVFTARPREVLFSPGTAAAVVKNTVARCQPESKRVMCFELFVRRPTPARVSTPLLVLGGELDGIITVGDVNDTARAYGTEATIFPGMGHNMMQEPGWKQVAEHMCAWLGERGL